MFNFSKPKTSCIANSILNDLNNPFDWHTENYNINGKTVIRWFTHKTRKYTLDVCDVYVVKLKDFEQFGFSIKEQRLIYNKVKELVNKLKQMATMKVDMEEGGRLKNIFPECFKK